MIGSGRISLSLDQAPPLSVPVRFFLTAPLFGVAAALTLFVAGPAALTSRWTPTLLGVTHLLTLGFIAMAMVGAMLQLLPVLAATPVNKPARVSASLHALLSSGALLLGAGLAARVQWPVQLALAVLGAGFLAFIGIVLITLRRSPSVHASIKTMRFAVLALAVTVSFGIVLGSGHGWSHIGLARQYTDLHLLWGLLGWVGLLSIGLAYQVVPMFQMTPEYPPLMQRILTPLLLVLLLVWSWGQLGLPMPPLVGWLGAVLLAAGFSWFGLMTLYLQGQRRRRVPDVTLWFWRLGMASLLACVFLWAGNHSGFAVHLPHYPLSVGVLMIVGFAISVINGMLYKILPFLIWLHLQTRAQDREARRLVPNVKKIISHERARWQWLAHLLALSLLLAAAWWPQNVLIYHAAVGCFALSCVMLWANLLGGLRTYRRYLEQMTTTD